MVTEGLKLDDKSLPHLMLKNKSGNSNKTVLLGGWIRRQNGSRALRCNLRPFVQSRVNGVSTTTLSN